MRIHFLLRKWESEHPNQESQTFYQPTDVAQIGQQVVGFSICAYYGSVDIEMDFEEVIIIGILCLIVLVESFRHIDLEVVFLHKLADLQVVCRVF